MMAEHDVARLRADWLRGEKALHAQHRAETCVRAGAHEDKDSDHVKPGFWDQGVALQHTRERRRLLAVGEQDGKVIGEAGEQHVADGSPAAPVDADGLVMATPSPFIQVLAQDFFRAECPRLSDCYRRVCRVAKHSDFSVVGAAEVGRVIRKLARKPEFRAYRKPGGGYLQRLESV